MELVVVRPGPTEKSWGSSASHRRIATCGRVNTSSTRRVGRKYAPFQAATREGLTNAAGFALANAGHDTCQRQAGGPANECPPSQHCELRSVRTTLISRRLQLRHCPITSVARVSS